VREFFDAVEAFVDHLTAVSWAALGVALLFHLLRIACRVVAWRNILAASYPGARVPFWGVYGSYVAGIGVTSLVPARGGDLLKLFLVKRQVEGSTYPTLGSTLLVETTFDAVVAGGILLWALTVGFLPGLDALPELPTIDWHWPLEHPKPAIAIGVVWAVVLVLLSVIGIRRAQAFWQRVRQGFAILDDVPRFLRGVIAWQAAGWILRASSVYWFLQAFGIPATLRNVLLVLAVQSVSTLFPFTPGGAGTQQGLLVFVLDRAEGGVAASTILSFSVGMHITLTAFNALQGFAAIFVMLRTLRWRRILLSEKVEGAGARR